MNLENPLVSIITPCYNGEHCVSRLMDSIIAQTYRPIEFILVNDGSTDGTLLVLENYIPKFRDAGIDILIINQENQGLGGAINTGLKHFKGDYLCWPDADDYLEPTSIEDRVRVLIDNPTYAVVTSDAYIRQANNIGTYTKKEADSFKYKDDPNQFEHLLVGNSIFCSGCHMVRTSMFLTVHPDREIFPARRGQNWQILLPIYYKYKWIYLDKPLYNYIIYPNSMSHGNNTMETVLNRYIEHETIIFKTLSKIEEIQNVELHCYYAQIYNLYSKLKMELFIKYGNKDQFFKIYNEKKKAIDLTNRDRLARYRINHPYINTEMKRIVRFIKKSLVNKSLILL